MHANIKPIAIVVHSFYLLQISKAQNIFEFHFMYLLNFLFCRCTVMFSFSFPTHTHTYTHRRTGIHGSILFWVVHQCCLLYFNFHLIELFFINWNRQNASERRHIDHAIDSTKSNNIHSVWVLWKYNSQNVVRCYCCLWRIIFKIGYAAFDVNNTYKPGCRSRMNFPIK